MALSFLCENLFLSRYHLWQVRLWQTSLTMAEQPKIFTAYLHLFNIEIHYIYKRGLYQNCKSLLILIQTFFLCTSVSTLRYHRWIFCYQIGHDQTAAKYSLPYFILFNTQIQYICKWGYHQIEELIFYLMEPSFFM